MIEKLRQLSETKRKVVFWSVLVALGGILLGWWVTDVQQRLSRVQDQRSGTEEVIEDFKNQLFQ